MRVPNSRTIIPILGTQSAKSRSSTSLALADALFTPVQQRVLGLLFGQPGRRYQSAELIRLAASGTGTAHRLLTRLAERATFNRYDINQVASSARSPYHYVLMYVYQH